MTGEGPRLQGRAAVNLYRPGTDRPTSGVRRTAHLWSALARSRLSDSFFARHYRRLLVLLVIVVPLLLAAVIGWWCAVPSGQEVTSSPGTVRVAAIQFISQWAKPAENRTRLETLIRQAARNGAKIVVLPEVAIPGYMSHDIRFTWQVEDRPISPGLEGVSPEGVAETVPGESTRAFGSLAKELKIYLTVPLVEVASKQIYYNTLVLMGPDGQIALHYRKLHPWRWAECGWATPGNRGLQVLDTPYGRLGLLICYDINFEPPKLKANRVDHLLYAIAWVDDEESEWFAKTLPGIARETNANIIGANWSVSDRPAWHGYGQSLVIRRNGRVLARARKNLGNEIVYADLQVP